MKNILVRELMFRNPVFADPDDTLEDAAVEMKNIDFSILPVGSRSVVRGVISDRDIIMRAVATGKDLAKEKVRAHMTMKPVFCNETDTIFQAADTMKQNKTSRLIVKNNDNKVSGILSFNCILNAGVQTKAPHSEIIHASNQND